jgi:hypothetical protein
VTPDAQTVTAYATAGAAIATAATAVVIAFQTVATRRSVRVAETLTLEAVKTRLDDQGPRVAVLVRERDRQYNGDTFYRGYRESAFELDRIPVATNRQFDQRVDLERQVALPIFVTAVNSGSERIRVQLRPVMGRAETLDVNIEPDGPLEILADHSEQFAVTISQTVELWRRYKLDDVVVELLVDDRRDNGVIDTWGVRVVANLFDDAAAWAVTDYAPGLRVLPRRRQYFLSKIDDKYLGAVNHSHGDPQVVKRFGFQRRQDGQARSSNTSSADGKYSRKLRSQPLAYSRAGRPLSKARLRIVVSSNPLVPRCVLGLAAGPCLLLGLLEPHHRDNRFQPLPPGWPVPVTVGEPTTGARLIYRSCRCTGDRA